MTTATSGPYDGPFDTPGHCVQCGQASHQLNRSTVCQLCAEDTAPVPDPPVAES